jgi:hypothetical protein
MVGSGDAGDPGDAVVAWAATLRLAGRANPASKIVPVTSPVRAHAR